MSCLRFGWDKQIFHFFQPNNWFFCDQRWVVYDLVAPNKYSNWFHQRIGFTQQNMSCLDKIWLYQKIFKLIQPKNWFYAIKDELFTIWLSQKKISIYSTK